jgi:hypothetical protein
VASGARRRRTCSVSACQPCPYSSLWTGHSWSAVGYGPGSPGTPTTHPHTRGRPDPGGLERVGLHAAPAQTSLRSLHGSAPSRPARPNPFPRPCRVLSAESLVAWGQSYALALTPVPRLGKQSHANAVRRWAGADPDPALTSDGPPLLLPHPTAWTGLEPATAWTTTRRQPRTSRDSHGNCAAGERSTDVPRRPVSLPCALPSVVRRVLETARFRSIRGSGRRGSNPY